MDVGEEYSQVTACENYISTSVPEDRWAICIKSLKKAPTLWHSILRIFSEGLTGYVHKDVCFFEMIVHSIYNKNLET